MRRMRKAAGHASDLMKALSSENRLMIVCQLAEGEKSVGDLADHLGLRQAAVSQQLALLRKDGLVSPRREAQTIYYSLAATEAQRVVALLYEMYCAPRDHEDVAGNELELAGEED